MSYFKTFLLVSTHCFSANPVTVFKKKRFFLQIKMRRRNKRVAITHGLFTLNARSTNKIIWWWYPSHMFNLSNKKNLVLNVMLLWKLLNTDQYWSKPETGVFTWIDLHVMSGWYWVWSAMGYQRCLQWWCVFIRACWLKYWIIISLTLVVL